ncbi:MAG: DinB family protein [Acidobacteriaceae bacterium]|nr:DinB family protein [Acidobacteriaceae bacterium]
MNPDVVECLTQSKQQMLSAVGGAAEDHAGASPAEGSWSIVQCLEHVSMVEAHFLRALRTATRQDAPLLDRAREEQLSVRLVDRSTKVRAPERAEPKGKITSVSDGVRAFETTRDQMIDFAKARADDLDYFRVPHPMFGEVSGTLLLRILAGHAARHADQIREIRARLEADGSR